MLEAGQVERMSLLRGKNGNRFDRCVIGLGPADLSSLHCPPLPLELFHVPQDMRSNLRKRARVLVDSCTNKENEGAIAVKYWFC